MSYHDQIAAQEAAVKKLNDEYAAKPNDELKAKIARETDLLRYLTNAAKGDPAGRAKRSATRAKNAVIGKIVA